MIDAALIVWFVLTAISALYVAWDAFTRNPELTVMKWGWILVTLYTGPIGAAIYVLSCKEPRPFTHERFVAPLWKQGMGSTIHCLAGDATGIVIAAFVTALLGFPMWVDVIAEYVFGFAFGLLVFQALFMRDMLGGSYLAAVKATFLPEWLSMNAVMAGMIPVMVVLMSSDADAMDPASLRFWGVMSLATLVGGVIAYPLNVWLVAVGLKHGMGTKRALGEGGHSMETEQALAPMPSAASREHAAAETGGHDGMASRVTPAEITAMTVLTLVALAAGVLIGALGGDFSMSGDHDDDHMSRIERPMHGHDARERRF